MLEPPPGVPHSDAMRTQSPCSVGLRSLASPIVLARLAGLATLATIAGCVPPPRAEAPPPRAEAPAPAPAPRPVPIAADWRDWPYSPGTWVYRRDARGSIALFGPANADAALTVRCDTGARQIYLSRAGSTATPLTIRTSSVTSRRIGPADGQHAGHAAAALMPNDLAAGGDGVQSWAVRRPAGRAAAAGGARLGRDRARDRGLPRLKSTKRQPPRIGRKLL
ncbi:hypothetical protein QP162_16920 [Sphingomonas aurantiaca]|uniref:hypothetical protein n=1 Tax=Sphingomonas aurantiaca TaxID=185949 RepID=UPI002FDF0E22